MDQMHLKKDKTFSIPIRKKSIVQNKKLTKKPQIKTTFLDSMRVTLICGQIFSLMPFNGVLSKNSNDIKFTITSWKCVYCLLSLMGHVFFLVMCVYQSIYSVVNFILLAYLVTVCCIVIMYIQIARSWPALVRYISQIEEIDPNFDNKLTIKCNVTCAVMMALSLLEHILFIVAAVGDASVCYHRRPDTYEGFIRLLFPFIFNFFPYSSALGSLMQLVQIQSHFIWNYSDLFLICISYYLTCRLEQINIKLKAATGKYLPEIFWRSAREQYYRATQLVKKVDEVISGIVFITFAADLLFICLQLFNMLENEISNTEFSGCSRKHTLFSGYKASIYFWFSLVYLITRSVTVSLTASQINIASVAPAYVLYEVPSPVYCVEVERFLEQVHGDKVALSGLQFFSVTRGLLLTVAGTIVTYELVMLQFNLPLPQHNSTEFFIPNNTTIATS